MKIIDQIMRSQYFEDQPPVLIDIGASGGIHSKWKYIAKYAYCLAFDADDREFHITEQINKAYKKLITFNRIVAAEHADQTTFYLTASPFCSSLLKPVKEKLEPWVFSPLFSVERVTRLPAITLQDSLQQANIDYIDWFKTDTQGTDLRLFTSLPSNLQLGILAAEFEPGIIDAYEGEDKLYAVMQEMDNKGFWLSSMEVKGVQRLHFSYTTKFGSFITKRILRKTPGWAEVTYLRQPPMDHQRQFLLSYVFALLERQYGFALEIIEIALQRYSDPLFHDCKIAVWRQIKAEKRKAPLVILKRQFNKLFSSIID
jgi:hypothetical protein